MGFLVVLETHAELFLRYLQINHHLGAIFMRFPLGQDHGSQLLQARSYFSDFLKIQDDYDILSTRHFQLYRQYLGDKDNFSTISTTDFTARRAEKIANYRMGKELDQKLEVSLIYYLYQFTLSDS